MKPDAQVTVLELQDHFADYLCRVEEGEAIIILKEGRPFAKIVPLATPKVTNRPKPGSMAGTVQILGEITGPVV